MQPIVDANNVTWLDHIIGPPNRPCERAYCCCCCRMAIQLCNGLVPSTSCFSCDHMDARFVRVDSPTPSSYVSGNSVHGDEQRFRRPLDGRLLGLDRGNFVLRFRGIFVRDRDMA